MATLQDYLGITALRDAWPKWKANVVAVNNQVINHVAGSADKHAAQDITYTGGFADKTEVNAALDQAKTEIDTIVINASIDPEVALARDSTVKGETFDTLDARLEEDEQDLESYKAESATLSSFPIIVPEVDDTARIQRAIAYAISNKKNLIGSNGDCTISNTIYIPRNADFDKQIILDFNNMNFIVPADVVLFESGYLDGATWFSGMGATIDTNNSFGMELKNFTIEGGLKGIRLNSWNIGCKVTNITSNLCPTVLEMNNCYYSEIDNVKTKGVGGEYLDTRFLFTGYSNLMKISRCTAPNSAIGYKFTGACIAVKFFSNSLEGQTVGVNFASAVYDVSVSDNYIENIYDTAFKFDSQIYNAKFSNNYFNFKGDAWYAFDFIPLPNNNIVIEADNMFNAMIDDSYFFKTVDNVVGYNLFTFKRPQKNLASLADLYSNPTHFSQQGLMKRVYMMPGGRGNLVNGYIPANYSGRYTNGVGALTGAKWVDNSNTVVTLETKTVYSTTQKIYVNLRVSASVFIYIKGEFIGLVFYEYTDTGVVVSTKLSIAIVDEFQVITSVAQAANITAVRGEVRLI